MLPKSTTDILRTARHFVEAGWTQGAYARDIGDVGVSPENSAAVCYCAVGALLAAGYQAGLTADEMRGHSIPRWNDDPVWADALDFAVAAARADYKERGMSSPSWRTKGAEALVRYNDYYAVRRADIIGWFDAALAASAKAEAGTNQ